MDITILNKNFGKSRLNVSARCLYCCYCDLMAALNYSELKSIKQFQPYEPELEDWQKVIDAQRKEGELASIMDYKQIIHKHCLARITKEEILLVRERNLNNQYVPLRSENKLLVIKNIRDIPFHDVECLRCASVFEERNLGYVFSHKGKSNYIHADCYKIMLNYQKKST